MAFWVESREIKAQLGEKARLFRKRLAKSGGARHGVDVSVSDPSSQETSAAVVTLKNDGDSLERRRSTAEALRDALNYIKMQDVFEQLMRLHRRIDRLRETIDQRNESEKDSAADSQNIQTIEEVYALEEHFERIIVEYADDYFPDLVSQDNDYQEEIDPADKELDDLLAECQQAGDVLSLNEFRFASFSSCDGDNLPPLNQDQTSLLLDTLGQMMELEAETLANKIRSSRFEVESGEEQRLTNLQEVEVVVNGLAERITTDPGQALQAIRKDLDAHHLLRLLEWPAETSLLVE